MLVAASVGCSDPVEQSTKVGDPELPVAVGEADQRIARRPQAAAEGRAVALVDAVVDRAHDVRVLGRQAVRDGAGAVRAAVVDADDLEPLGQPGQLRERLRDERLDVLGLVVGREEVAQAARTNAIAGIAGRGRVHLRRTRRIDRRRVDRSATRASYTGLPVDAPSGEAPYWAQSEGSSIRSATRHTRAVGDAGDRLEPEALAELGQVAVQADEIHRPRAE